jgi:hypothetical protein
MEKISYQVTHTLDKEELKDILTTAIEGGISYWACLGNDDPEWIAARDRYEKEHKEIPLSEKLIWKNLTAAILRWRVYGPVTPIASVAR